MELVRAAWHLLLDPGSGRQMRPLPSRPWRQGWQGDLPGSWHARPCPTLCPPWASEALGRLLLHQPDPCKLEIRPGTLGRQGCTRGP